MKKCLKSEKRQIEFIKYLNEFEKFHKSISRERQEEIYKIIKENKREKYSNTKEWKTRCDLIKKAYCNKCGHCGRLAPKLEVHHRFGDSYGNESFIDLIPLCKKCHSKCEVSKTVNNETLERKIYE